MKSNRNANRTPETVVVEDENRELHCLNGPARISRWWNGNLCYVEYFVHGVRHRDDGPAELHHREDGSLIAEIYIADGLRHRVDGPAHTIYNPDGTVCTLEYYEAGNLHRTDGPACQSSAGRVEWFIEGVKLEGLALVNYLSNNNLAFLKTEL